LNNLFDLTGKVALITGKSGMLAPVWVETLENAGCKVYCGEPLELGHTLNLNSCLKEYF
jgi:NAD(P)-dependent dehydrogenase (short-subunit alcohol dehydrogenase family)